MAGRVEPYLDSPALYQWTQCAMNVLCSKDVKGLRCRLPALLQASDERVLQALAPSGEAYGVASFMGAQRQVPEVEAQTQPTLAQVDVVSEPAGVLLTAPQAPVASELAEAPLTSVQTPEVGQPAPKPMQAGGRARFAQSGPVVIPVCARCRRGALLPRLAGLLALANARAGA